MAPVDKSPKGKPMDLITRGEYASSPAGTAAFIGLRSADLVLQYGILKHGVGANILHKVGLQTLPQGLPMNSGIALIDKLGLSPYRLILLSMATGSTLKQVYWLLFTSFDSFKLSAAVPVSIYNTVVNSLNNLLFTCALTSGSLSGSETFPQPPLIVGGIMYVVGMALEAISETQRYAFKKKPENKGQLYTKGLFKLSRHINYFGYALWRSGFAMAAGGFVWGAAFFAFQFYDFASRSSVTLSDYCQERYGVQWEAYKRQTPYAIIPYVY